MQIMDHSKHVTPRRAFLALAIGAGGWGLAQARGTRLHVRQARALGAPVTLTLRAEHADHADAAAGQAFAELRRIESALSLYRPDSELCRLNRTGRLDEASDDLLAVLDAAAQTSARSEGAFDVTVQALWALHDRCRLRGVVASEREIAQARARVDWRRVLVRGREVRLLPPVECITLNGIAQGYATDRAALALRRAGVQDALIDAGELAPLATTANPRPRLVGIRHPRSPEALIAAINLRDRCLATSGDYVSVFTPDRKLHHLLDPVTGLSPVLSASVSVLAPTAMQADALSTALFILGPERGLRLARESAGIDALFVLKDGRALATPGFPPVVSS
jgi:thiamine biosynthesis lipoprotein